MKKNKEIIVVNEKIKKKYIIIARSICGIGGAEIYLRNKFRFLRNLNYEVIIISAYDKEIKIRDLEQFKEFIIPELLNDPFLYTIGQQKKILNRLIKISNNSSIEESEFVIESSFIQGSLWGELLADRLKCRNFSFLLDDLFPKLNHSAYDFFIFKLNRKELVGITENSLELLFNQEYKLLENQHYFLSFICINSIEQHIEDYFNFDTEQFDICVGSIGRINKTCVPMIISGIKRFACKYQNKKILFVLFGGGENDKKMIKKYIYDFKNLKNVKFIITGELYPIPYNSVNNFDLFISTAGSARATWYSGIPTLSVELLTGVPLGLLGINTESTQYRMKEDKIIWESIEDAMESIFIYKTFNLNDIRNRIPRKEIKIDFTPHISFMNKSVSENNFEIYNFKDYKVNKFLKIIVSIIYGVFGGKILVLFINIYKKLKHFKSSRKR